MEELETKDKILKGSEELFRRYGIRSISMDDIARHLSVSKKTLYQHFADKEDLVVAVSKSHLQSQHVVFQAVKATAANSVEHLAKISVCMKQEMDMVNPAMLFDIQKFHPKAWAIWLNFKKELIQEVVDNLKQGIDEGFIREDVNPEIFAVLRVETIQAAFTEELFQEKKIKLSEIQTQLFDHFVYGLVTDKGKKVYQKCKNKSIEITNP